MSQIAKRNIRMSPAEYINEKGILKQLGTILSQKGLHKPVILTDKTVYPIIQPYLPKAFLERHPVEIFGGSCTFEEINRLTDKLGSFDVLLAFGGGQLIDTAKLVADRLHIPIINSQTVPSNCAAITTKSIVYSQAHEKIDNVRHKKAVDMVLLEPNILMTAPREYILSGIGDTLAKYYEIRRRLTLEKTSQLSLRIGRFFIDLCREEMLKVKDLENLTEEEVINLIDTIFLVAASVDGISDQDGHSVIAHAFYNGYVKIQQNYTKTHGETVALGSLVQILIEGEDQLAQEIVTYHKRVGLPLTLKELGLEDEDEIDELASYIARPEDSRVQSIFPDLNERLVRQTLEMIRG
ncbi:iron-containing alcohol dehydrogenase family protein [Streptococcus dentapri]|uniref:Iron-containing alcohol dehydrogenase family protein n=1 Tax=Streptococcus dentapri TaxID=573564 RepID=A0ABV8D2N2_9STRE